MKLTTDMIMPWVECTDVWTRERVAAKVGKGKTPLQIARMKSVSVEDRLWVLLRPEIIPDAWLCFLACDFAEERLRWERHEGRELDPRSWNAIEVSRRFAVGKATKKELDAAWNAARAATREAAWAAWEAGDAAAWAAWAAWNAAGDAAAWDAAWAAAWNAAARAWQIRRVIEVLTALEKLEGKRRGE